MSASDDDIEDSAAPLIEHLAELRTRLIRSVIAFIVAMCVFFIPVQGDFIAEHVLKFLFVPIEQTMRAMGNPTPTFQFTAGQELLFAQFRVSMVFGLGLSFPFIGFQLWRFVAPGLYKNEKNAFLPFLIASPLMFILGASFAHFVVTPLAVAFLIGFADASSLFDAVTADGGEAVKEGLQFAFQPKVDENLRLVLVFILAFGLCFQLPVLLTLMGKAGLVSAEGLAAVRKFAAVGILVLAAVVTPPDVITQLILFTVVFGLYELSIFLVRMVEKRREADLRAQGLWFEDDDEEEEDPLMAEFDKDEDAK
ncbi:Sec-independent protein translocase protein TatC [Pelagimonas phthalicica]|uniref:Sec-independent protein translocase protein TatC n=1 Tax=Pelagimonas phthalicica TaxID=1037362 RepID=A0A238JEX6_9RHOB|nr:twin-arginine translocase subunit TatC [Pelagimonas phthalicica]TDS91659.1 sec-independent protein translocase protein TatC [Pelagimonas phthalicica]SMX28707.1 Sec-independent protein translocase protein TatC [Pelagimonas phthalicica]